MEYVAASRCASRVSSSLACVTLGGQLGRETVKGGLQRHEYKHLLIQVFKAMWARTDLAPRAQLTDTNQNIPSNL